MDNSTLLERELRLISESAFVNRLGCKVVGSGDASAEVRLPHKPNNLNRSGTIHGGVTAALALVASNVAVAASQRGQSVISIRPTYLSISYLSAPIREELRSIARVVHRGRDVAHVSVDVQTLDGRPIATAWTTERLFEQVDGVAGEVVGFEASQTELPVASGFAQFDERSGTRVGRSAFLKASDIEVYVDSGPWACACLPVPANEGLSGALHDGAVAALVDSAGAFASYSGSGVSFESPSSTVAMSIGFALRRPGRLCAASRLVSRTGNHFSNQVEVFEPSSGHIVAFGTVTYRIPEPR